MRQSEVTCKVKWAYTQDGRGTCKVKGGVKKGGRAGGVVTHARCSEGVCTQCRRLYTQSKDIAW